MNGCNKCSKKFANTLESIQHYCDETPTDKPHYSYCEKDFCKYGEPDCPVIVRGATDRLQLALASDEGKK